LKLEEYQQLEANILDEGCREALILWGGILVDGHNRYKICQEHDIPFKTCQLDFEDRRAVRMWIRTNQLGRRNLKDWQRGELVTDNQKEALLEVGREKKTEEGKLTGRGHKKVLSDSDKTFEPPHNTQKVLAAELGWSTGKVASFEAVRKENPELYEKAKKENMSIDAAYNLHKKEKRKKEIETERKVIADNGKKAKPADRWHIYHGDIKTWQSPRQYDFIITDPPYPKEYLPLWSDLGRRSLEWLKDGGLLIAMSGQSYLNEIYTLLCEYLDYYWTACYLTPGQPTPLRQVNVNTTWKPLLIFAKGQYKGKIFGDVFKSDDNEKEFHKWGQSVSGMTDVVSKICLAGQSILDPFCGAGTTGIAAIKHGCFFDGLEIDLDNVNISKGRLNDIEAT
jgi:site-specific DNA-methyltransferase (adenine-specific)